MAGKSECEQAVYEFLHKTNRPQGQSEIVGIFSGQYKEYPTFKKPFVISALDALRDGTSIIEKQYNKQKIYAVNQSIFKDQSKTPEDMAKLKEQVSSLRKQADELQSEHKRLITEENRSKETFLNIDEINEQIKDHKSIVGEYEAKLALYKKLKKENAQEAKSISVTALKKKRTSIFTELKRRRKIFIEMIETIMEHYPKRKTDLFNDIGLETGELDHFNEKFKELNNM